MTLWVPQDLGDNVSVMAANDDKQDQAIMSHQAGATQPPYFPTGAFWFNQNHGAFGAAIVFSAPGGSVTDLMDPKYMQLNAGGTVPWAANQNAGGKRLTGLGEAVADADAVSKVITVLRDGSQAYTGNQDAGGKRIENLGAPVGDDDAARKIDLTSAVPEYAGTFYFQTNRDEAGNGNPVRLEDEGDKAGSSTIIGDAQNFVPRRVTVRLFGTFYDQDDGDQEGPQNITEEFEVRRFEADATGGDPGTSGTIVLGTISSAGKETVTVELEWRYLPAGSLGFWLRVWRPSGGQFQWLKNPTNSAVDGTIQIICEYGGV